jgi:hypothetical protein
MHDLIENFEAKIESLYFKLLLNAGYFAAGESQIRGLPDNYVAQVIFNENEVSEKVTLAELRKHSEAVESSIAELFQIKSIAAFGDLLTEIFTFYVARHLSGTPVPLLANHTAKINFALSDSIPDQIKRSIIENFAFQPYAERISIVRKLLDPGSELKDELVFIKKHVLIRNSTQHHDGKFYAKMSTDLGASVLMVLNSSGKEAAVAVGEHIVISGSEVLLLKKYLLKVTSAWKNNFPR